MAEKEHHLFGGSSACYWSNCFGWASKIVQITKGPAGIKADIGTALHTGILERRVPAEVAFLTEGTPIDYNYDGIENWPPDGPEMADDFWHELWTKVLEEIITGKFTWFEKKVMFDEELDAGGTADVLVLYKDDKNKLVLWVGDLKTGRIQVEPDDEQMLFYSVCAYIQCKAKGIEVDEFRTFIYQPTSDPKFKEHKFTKAQILRAEKKYAKAIAESKADKPKFKAGEWCEYCKVKGDCVAYNKHCSTEMNLEEAKVKGFPDVEKIPDETLLKIWQKKKDIVSLVKEVDKLILKRAIQGNPVEGTKMVAGSGGKSKWTDEIKAEEVLTKFGIDPTTKKLMGQTAIKGMLKGAKVEKKVIDATIASLVTKPPPKPTITTVDDPRPVFVIAPDLLGAYEEDEDEEDSESSE